MTKLLIVAVFATCLAMTMAQPWHYAKYCDDPETPDHGGFKPDRKVHALKDRVDFYCKNRYRLVGAKSAVCTYDRKTGKIGWSNPSPKCVAIVCPALDDITYGQVEVTGTRQGDKANYFCNYGFYLSGNTQRVCQIDGSWSGAEPSCVPITCSDLSDPQYGSVSTTGNRVGDLADYECDSGFRLKGDLQRVCLSSGEWSGVPPTCAAILCPDLLDILYGSVKLTGRRIGSNAIYQCNRGFRLEGSSQRTCNLVGKDGQWGGEAPKCVQIKCPNLDDPKDGSVDVSGVLPGDKAKYRCDYGFRLDGEHTRTCQYNGVWTGQAPTCKRIPYHKKPYNPNPYGHGPRPHHPSPYGQGPHYG